MREFDTVGLQLGKHSPLRPEILCTHGAKHTFNDGGLRFEAGMDGRSRPESMWEQRSQSDKRNLPPSLQKALKYDEHIAGWAELWMLRSGTLCLARAQEQFAHAPPAR